MLCCVCKEKEATVHLTQIAGDKMQKVDLCEECAKTKGVNDPTGFSLADLLVKPSLNPETATPGVRCEQCGFTQADFKRLGRLGCPVCYETFKDVLGPMLESIHKGTTHLGKIPHTALNRKSLHDRLNKLELDLNEAIKTERYEEAARYRDEISRVKQSVPEKPERA